MNQIVDLKREGGGETLPPSPTPQDSNNGVKIRGGGGNPPPIPHEPNIGICVQTRTHMWNLVKERDCIMQCVCVCVCVCVRARAHVFESLCVLPEQNQPRQRMMSFLAGISHITDTPAT